MRILVAGIGNLFLGDDGFGCAVAKLLADRPQRPGVVVADYGIRGMDLALALTSGIDAAILVDAVARGGTPGTLYVIEPELATLPAATYDNHAMHPAAVLRLATSLGELPSHIRIVGCEPAHIDPDDVDVGLSAPVDAAVTPAADLVGELVEAACTR